MRVFILTTGRSGSMTYAKACSHIENFTSGHESRAGRIKGRLDYPDNHIEVDNRLSWFLGSLDKTYGTDPLYVYLKRNRDEVVRSYARRIGSPMSIIRATANGILLRREPQAPWRDVAELVVDTMTDNIEVFLRDKPNMIETTVDNPQDFHAGFDEMWDWIGAEGDLEAAHRELTIRHNATPKGKRNW